jgi:hypothetical protein
MPLTWEDLKQAFPPEVWKRAVKDFDEAEFGNRFLSMARAWLKARLQPCEISSWNEDSDDVIRQILLYRAQYEFYAFFEKETLAADKKDSAEELLRARFGACIEETREASGVFYPYAYVTESSSDWRGFSA